jgi:pseudouridine synthase
MLERLQKIIAAAGVASRRQAEELIRAGEVSVNGHVVTELGTKADPERDHVKVRGRLINSQLAAGREKVYVLLNKPKGYLTSLSDPEGRPLVSELVPATLGRLHPVGRLDFNTEGLLILTNDGELTNYVTAARNKVPKVYEAKVKGIPPEDAVERLRRGVVLEDGVRTAPAQVKRTGETESNAWFEIILHEGRNQQIRRMFDVIGHSVVKLRRVAIGRVRDERLKPGMWRRLTASEVAGFKRKERRGAGGDGGERQKESAKGARGGGGEERRQKKSAKGSGAGAGREPSRGSRRGRGVS